MSVQKGKFEEAHRGLFPQNLSDIVGVNVPTALEIVPKLTKAFLDKDLTGYTKFGYVRYKILTSDVVQIKQMGLRQAQLSRALLTVDRGDQVMVMFVEPKNFAPITYAQYIASTKDDFPTETDFKASLLKIVLPNNIRVSRTPQPHEEIQLTYPDLSDVNSAQFNGYTSSEDSPAIDSNLPRYRVAQTGTKDIYEARGA
tara:strand:+ start:729 stop:1325 length:597 start_codon:yes stop_codon:yes gene_type:complete